MPFASCASATDRNEFNNEQALRALVEHLEVLR